MLKKEFKPGKQAQYLPCRLCAPLPLLKLPEHQPQLVKVGKPAGETSQPEHQGIIAASVTLQTRHRRALQPVMMLSSLAGPHQQLHQKSQGTLAFTCSRSTCANHTLQSLLLQVVNHRYADTNALQP